MSKQYYSWPDMIKLCQALTEQIEKSGEEFTDIVALARGGLFPAQYLAYQLKIDRVYSIGINFYKDDELHEHPALYQALTNSFAHRKVLIVDELIDTGRSMEFAISELEHRWCKNIHTACIWYKADTSTIVPNYYLKETSADDWIVLPYD